MVVERATPGPARPRARTVPRPVHGGPALAASFTTPLANAVLVVAWCVFMTVLTAPVPMVGLLFGLLGLAACSRLAPFVLGRASAGGVYLTSTAIELRWGVRSASVPGSP